MKHKITQITLLLLFLIGYSAHACDVINGSDIKFKHLGGYKYKVTFALYHQCVCKLSVMPTFTISCGSSQLKITPPRISIKDITPTCSSGQPACTNGGYNGSRYGIEEHTFEDTIDFSKSPYSQFVNPNCCEVMFRVAQPWGLVGTTTSTTSYGGEAMLNLCNIGNKGNNSPTISTLPMSFMCCNQPFTFNNGVFDLTDNDSLAFELDEPLSSGFMPVTWVAPLNKNIPLTPYCAGQPGVVNCKVIPNARPPRGFYFDKETGDMVLTPVKCDESGPVAIKVTEYRRDSATKQMVKIGFVRRDIYVTVVTCSDNNPPVIEGNNKHSICEGEKLCFTIKGTDAMFAPKQTVPDTVFMTWNGAIPGASFTIVDPNAREKEAEFCWTPAVGSARNQAYGFAVTAKDDACPRPAYTIKGFNIKVNPKARAKRRYDILDCGKFRLNSFAEDTVNFPLKNYLYKFTIRDSTNAGVPLFISNKRLDSFKFKRGGKYIIEHEITNPPYNCPTLYSDTVIIPPVLEIDLAFGKDTFVCAGDKITLKPIVANGVPNYRFQWESPLGTKNPKDTLSEFTIQPNAPTRVVLTLTDSKKCVDKDTIKVNYQPNPIVDIGPDKRICTYNSIVLDAQNADTMRYYWLPNGDSSRTIEVNIAGKYIAKVIDTLGCYTKDTMELFVNDTVVAIAKPNKEICINDTLKITGKRRPNGYTRNIVWKDLNTNATMANDSSFKTVIKTMDSRKYELYLKVNQSGVVCEDKDTFTLTVNALPTFKFKGLPPHCFGDGAVNLTLNQLTTGYSGDKTQNQTDIKYFQSYKNPSWITGGPVGVNTYMYDYPKFITNAQVPKEGLKDTLCYEFRDYKGCYNKECQPVKLNPNPVVELKEGTFCQKAGLINLDKLVVKPFSKVGGIQTFTCISVPESAGVEPSLVVMTDYSTVPQTHLLDPGEEGENHKTGEYLIEYCFKDAITGCEACDTTSVFVIKLPEISFDFIPNECINNGLLQLDSFAFDKNTGKRFHEAYWRTVEYSNSRNMSNPVIADKINNSMVNHRLFNPKYGPGVFIVKLTDTSSGCPVSDSTEILVNGLPIIRIDVPDTICSSTEAFALNNITPAGAVGTWSGPGVIGRNFDPSISPLIQQYEGKYLLKYEYTNPLTKCTASDSQSLLIQTQPNVKILTEKPYQQCEGMPFYLNSEKEWAKNVIWSSNGDGSFNGTQSSLSSTYNHGFSDTAIAEKNGVVQLKIKTVKEGVCPVSVDSIDLKIEPYPQFDFTADEPVQCEPAIMNFTALVNKPLNSPKLKYSWQFGNGESSIDNSTHLANNVSYDTANRNWYDVVLKIDNRWGEDANMVCSVIKDSISYIKVLPQPKADFISNPGDETTVAFPKFKFENKTNVRWQSPGYMSYIWHFGIGDVDDTVMSVHPVYIYPPDTNKYRVHLSSIFNFPIDTVIRQCQDTIGKVRIINPDVTVFVPNAFSPDNSGPTPNNGFLPIVNGEISYHVELYNRWGQKLWESDDKFESWDGTFMGEKVQQDVYIWYIKVQGYDFENYTYEGTVTLLR
jgi:gliding motility-associated-like protein